MQPFTRADFLRRGLGGFLPFAALRRKSIPPAPGVYAFLRPDLTEPVFLDRNPSGRWKGKNPTVSAERLHLKWLPEAECVYLGKGRLAHEAHRADAGLRQRPIRHWGGRLLWQVGTEYEFEWMETPGQNPRTVWKGWLREFSAHYGSLPFAKLRH